MNTEGHRWIGLQHWNASHHPKYYSTTPKHTQTQTHDALPPLFIQPGGEQAARTPLSGIRLQGYSSHSQPTIKKQTNQQKPHCNFRMAMRQEWLTGKMFSLYTWNLRWIRLVEVWMEKNGNTLPRPQLSFHFFTAKWSDIVTYLCAYALWAASHRHFITKISLQPKFFWKSG